MSFRISLTVPTKRPMCKINVYPKLVIEWFPNPRDLFALRDRVRRNKGGVYRGILHQFGRLIVPPCHIVNFTGSFIRLALFIYINGKNIALLFLTLQGIANKRRIPHNIIQLTFGNHALPIHLQSIALYNKGVCFQRQKFERDEQDFLRFFHHLAFRNPERGFCNRHSKVVDFDAVKLADGNLYRAFAGGIHRDLTVGEFHQNFVFQAAQAQISFGQKVSAAARGV